jgi:hypothetical protein
MACTSNTCLARIELQIKPILPEGYGLMRALGAFFDILQDAFEMCRVAQTRQHSIDV